MMDWVSWLSKSNIEPSLVYEYALAFAGNELEEEDIPYLNHEILQSMGISVAKHRLEIIKLARKETGEGISQSPNSKLVSKFSKTKKKLTKRFSKIFHKDSTKALPELPWHQETWGGSILTKSKSERGPRAERMIMMTQDDNNDMFPRQLEPLELRMQEGMMSNGKSIRVSGSPDDRIRNRMYSGGSLDLSSKVDGRVQDRQVLTNRKSRLSAAPDGRVRSKTASQHNKEKLNPFDESDDDEEKIGDHILWRAVHQDMK